MVYKKEVIEERLKHLLETLGRLKPLSKMAKNKFLEDYAVQWQAERGLQLAAEAFFDIGDHILASHYSYHPTDYEDVISALADRRVISNGLARRLAGLGGFRNIIVHEYLAKGLDDFYDFIKEVLRWMK